MEQGRKCKRSLHVPTQQTASEILSNRYKNGRPLTVHNAGRAARDGAQVSRSQDVGGTAVVAGQSTPAVGAARASALAAFSYAACPAFLDAIASLSCSRPSENTNQGETTA